MCGKIVESKDVVAGRILWLPPLDNLPSGSVETVGDTPPILDEAFNHPVVVCSRPADRDGDIVHFHIITSFHNKSLSERFNVQVKKQRRQVNWYLPIAPAEYHTEDTEARFGRPLIELEGGKKMSSVSYINAKDIYAVDWRLLTRYQNKGWYRLTAESIEYMNERTGRLVSYQPGEQYFPGPFPVQNPSPTPAKPIAPPPGQTTPTVLPPVDMLPPVDNWSRVEVVAPFRLAGGNKAIIFVGTVTSGDGRRNQALYIVPEPEQNLHIQPEETHGIFTIIAAPFMALGAFIGRIVCWIWQAFGYERARPEMV